MNEMSSLERLKRMCEHREGDRVPIIDMRKTKRRLSGS